MPTSTYAHLAALPPRPLYIRITPQPWPTVDPVAFIWTPHRIIAAIHPGTRGYDIAMSVIDMGAPDWLLEQWLAGYDIHAPAARIRAQWRALLGPMTDIPAYTPNIPEILRA